MLKSGTMQVNDLIDFMVGYATQVGKNGKTIPINKINPVMLWGPPGVGKSQAMKQAGELIGKKLEKKVVFHDVRLLNMAPTDLRGIPVADANKETAIWLKPHIFKMDESDKVLNILILDEISAAPPSVQSSAYQIVLDRCIGEHKIPDNCLIMCAGNRVTDKSVAYKMPKALANRLGHFDIEPNVDDFKKWAIPKGFDTRVLAYVSYHPDKLYAFDPNTDDNAFPTPRSWEKVNDVLEYLDLEKAMPLVKGLIGEAHANDFLLYTKVFHYLPNLDEVLEGKFPKSIEYDKKVDGKTQKVNLAIDKLPPDINYATVSAMVAKAVLVEEDKDYQLTNLLRFGMTLKSEFVVKLFKDIFKVDPAMQTRLAKNEAFKEFKAKYNKLIVNQK